MEQEIRFGAHAVPVILSAILGLIFKMAGTKIEDRWKSVIAVVCGVGLGILAIPYNGLEWTLPTVVDYAISGFMIGASSVGLYELQRSAMKPR